MAKKSGRKKQVRGPNQMMLRRTLFLMIVCGIVAFIVLAIQLFRLQILDHDKYESLAIDQQVRETNVSANRGTIYDRNGKILAASADVSNIFISPAEIKKNNEDPVLIAQGLSEILGVDYGKILEMTQDTGSWYKTVARKVEDDLTEQVRQFKSENNLIGVKIESDTKRYYPYGSLASHVIGFVGTDNYGLSGIESYYDDVLTGTDGRVIRATNAAGTQLLYTNYEDYYDAQDGSDVVLTIDATIQYYLEKHLQQAVEDYDIRKGAAAIAMDPKTGEILGLVSLDNFDLNNYQAVREEVQEEIDAAETDEEKSALLSAAQQKQWRNKAISDTYEPGSVFKIITLSMALEEGVTDINDSFYCGGSIQVTGDDEPRNCWKRQGHGAQTLTQAVQHSCNVAFINLGVRVGARSFYKYAEAFGFLNLPEDTSAIPSARTGIDIAGESGSIWWSQDLFYQSNNLSQLAAASFGQTFTVTPIQMITAVSACINGGYLMKPYLVKEVQGDDGEVLSTNQPTVVRQVISEDTSATVRNILERVVGDPVDGTGKNAYVAGYSIGGKTGTSEKVSQDAAGGAKEYIVSFLGFAPTDDPKIAILVLLDTPSNDTGIYISGGQMAAPVVGNMMADILPYLGVEPDYSETEKENMDKTMPDVKGMSLTEAQIAVTNAGLTCRVIGDGDTVTDQLPVAYSIIADGSQVILYAGTEPSAEQEAVPNLIGYSYTDAALILSWYGLFVRTDSSVTNPDLQMVSTQSIAEGEMVDHGTIVNVTLVSGDTSMQGRY
ncbi:MAG: penicillin-binding transpeptidase domain-containing protein [Oscillospiraceae bacterium]|nr:penicillin-binding transpeptidase domain-containing protein [Oscillospiraceae bacterium]